jgi:hypothetical protein
MPADNPKLSRRDEFGEHFTPRPGKFLFNRDLASELAARPANMPRRAWQPGGMPSSLTEGIREA